MITYTCICEHIMYMSDVYVITKQPRTADLGPRRALRAAGHRAALWETPS